MEYLSVEIAGVLAAAMDSLEDLEVLKIRIEVECAPGPGRAHLLYWLDGRIEHARKGRLGKAVMSPEAIAQRLSSEYGYSAAEASIGGEGLWAPGATRGLMDAEEAWWYGEGFVDFEAHGESLRRLTEEKGYTLPAALWLMKHLLCVGGEIAPVHISGDPFTSTAPGKK